MNGLEYSALQKVFCIGDEQIQVYIYRQSGSDWRLHLVNSQGASHLLDERFDSDVEAMRFFDELHGGSSDIEFSTDAELFAKEQLDVNVSLLEPQYAWYRDVRTKNLYTLCKFDLVRKYAGLWPARNLVGHRITGYLYKGDAPQWPHPPKGLPGAPENIDVEFTVLPKHIDFYVENDRALRDSSYLQ